MKSTQLFVAVVTAVALNYVVANNNNDRDLSLNLNLVDQKTYPNARCLDGTPPGYYFRPGVDDGEKSVILFLQGGGWCYPSDIQQLCEPATSHCTANCHIRAKSKTGSSSQYPSVIPPGAIEGGTGYTSGNPNNTAFSNFAVAYANYCDGGSFSGTRTTPDIALNGTGPLYYAGKYNLDAIAHDLLAKQGKFERIIISGCSAGGMACYLHCDPLADFFAATMPGVDVKCICDAGVFLDVPTVTGAGNVMKTRFYDLANRMETKASLNAECVAKERHWQECMFSATSLKYVKTPLFAMNSMYNFGAWEMLSPPTNLSFPPDTVASAADWTACWPTVGGLSEKTYANCNQTQKEIISKHFATFKADLKPALDPQTPHGAWLSSCPSMHCQTGFDKTVVVNGMTVGDAAASWYFNNTGEKQIHIDQPFPHNPSCPTEKPSN